MSFVGNIEAKDSFNEIVSSDDTFLIDVRSFRELYVDGVAHFENHADKLLFCEWRGEYSVYEKKEFLGVLLSRIDLSDTSSLFFICRSGIRSLEAAEFVGSELAKMGEDVSCVNVSDGYEGNAFKMFGFGEKNGWKAAGLPYTKSEEVVKTNISRGSR